MQKNNKQPETPAVFETGQSLRAFVQAQRKQGKKIALVPTMGALHNGHLSLVRQGIEKADCVIASIFVNPAQFGANEDLDAYPRPWESDFEKLEKAGVHSIFRPSVKEIYPDGFATMISVKHVSEPLEGAHRPGHFDGVATIVAKLFWLCQPDIALFGEKDWQQLQIIRRMVTDLNIPVEILGAPIIRDEKGLALSSRNAYLSQKEYGIACQLNKILFSMAQQIKQGHALPEVRKEGRKALEKAGFDKIDYLEILDEITLEAAQNGSLRIFAAVKIGKTRLIDNVPVLY
ncbi:MAG: pantoate--beta-alanine ligase [Alphaproteobacteria bacterium CG_4_9_14_3_um_filter_47_13]|nr:MAG: pantoate--beta-alanine ligase [Alphaproteobacteria bacterium CG_4_9_14_3_um_filter_47_13]